MGGFQNMMMWREWRQVFFSCLCSGSRPQTKINGVVWGVFFSCFCSGLCAHANTKLIFLSINIMDNCSGSRAHAKINCW